MKVVIKIPTGCELHGVYQLPVKGSLDVLPISQYSRVGHLMILINLPVHDILVLYRGVSGEDDSIIFDSHSSIHGADGNWVCNFYV